MLEEGRSGHRKKLEAGRKLEAVRGEITQGLPDEAPSGQGLESRTEVLGGVESGGVRPSRERRSEAVSEAEFGLGLGEWITSPVGDLSSESSKVATAQARS